MLIHQKLPGDMYPQLTQFPANYPDFLEAFRGGQTVDNNTFLTTGNTLQTAMYKTALMSEHLTVKGNPILGVFLVDIFLTDAGAEFLQPGYDRKFCRIAVDEAKKSIPENDGEPHPCVGAVIVKDGKILATGFRGETGDGRHAEFCALKRINDDVDNVDLRGCTVYTTLEPCSNRKSPNKTACATRLINAKVARVVYGLADKDESVYGHVSLAEAGIDLGLFPKDLIQELVALNKKWSDTRRQPEVVPSPNDTSPIADASYYKPGTSMQDNIYLFVRPPKDARGFHTIEDAVKNVLAYGRSLEEIAVEWRKIDTQKVVVEKLVRQGTGSSNRLLNLT
jgi:pyrimidine deaminase RibD-like protein